MRIWTGVPVAYCLANSIAASEAYCVRAFNCTSSHHFLIKSINDESPAFAAHLATEAPGPANVSQFKAVGAENHHTLVLTFPDSGRPHAPLSGRQRVATSGDERPAN